MILPEREAAAAQPPRSRAEALCAAAASAFEAQHGPGPGAPVVVVMAALDEASSVGDVVRSVPADVDGIAVDCLVVDDGSSDPTAELARSAGAMVCRLGENLGQGSALRLGYRLAAGRGAVVIATLDADGQFDPAELPRLVRPVLDGRADFVNGSRRLGSAARADLMRRAGITMFGWLVTVLVGTRITDPANGFRAFRTEVVAAVPQRQAQYQTAELLIGAAALGLRIVEAPVTVRARSAGESKKGGNLRYGYRFARVVVGTWWRLHARPRLAALGRAQRHLP